MRDPPDVESVSKANVCRSDTLSVRRAAVGPRIAATRRAVALRTNQCQSMRPRPEKCCRAASYGWLFPGTGPVWPNLMDRPISATCAGRPRVAPKGLKCER